MLSHTFILWNIMKEKETPNQVVTYCQARFSWKKPLRRSDYKSLIGQGPPERYPQANKDSRTQDWETLS